MSDERFPFACSAFAHRARGVAQAPKRPASKPGARPESGALLRYTPTCWHLSQPNNLRAWLQAQARCAAAVHNCQTWRRQAGPLKTAETTRQNRPVCWLPVYMATAPVVMPQACTHRTS